MKTMESLVEKYSVPVGYESLKSQSARAIRAASRCISRRRATRLWSKDRRSDKRSHDHAVQDSARIVQPTPLATSRKFLLPSERRSLRGLQTPATAVPGRVPDVGRFLRQAPESYPRAQA